VTHATQRICRSAIAITLFCGAVSAQTLSNSGINQDLGRFWRTPTTAKLDVDGNNILGTDGYYVPKSNNQPTQTLVPAYVTGYTLAASVNTYSSAIVAGNCTYALIDDPTVAQPGATMCTGNINRNIASGTQVPLISFTLQGNVPAIIRLAVMMDNYDLTGFNSVAIQVSDAPAFSPNVATTSAAFKNKNPDWIYFDIVGGLPGQVVTILATAGTNNQAGIGGFALDSLANAVDGYKISYFSNLAIGESVINLTNTGASSNDAGLTGGTFAQNGEICANLYAYSPDEQLVSCCSCNVTPNGLNSLSVKADLATNTLTPIIPSSLVVKIIATAGGSSCTASTAATVNALTQRLPGLLAWGSTLHALPVTPGTPAGTYGGTETPFLTATMSPAELTRMTQLCAFIRSNGSGFGICKSCKVGGLGASAK